ncbi:MAG TPA: EAL domain-containing protein [Acidimicrobiales bacterium]|nr:EAL domain-containing protein [Acidimicrobiales bacterium]
MRVAQWSLVGGFAVVGALMTVLPIGRTELRSEFLHVPYVLALAGGAAVTAWSTWVRFRMDGTSRAWLLSAAFGVLALLFAPHALYDASGPDPVGFFYGPISRLAFGLLLIVAMSPFPVPRVLRHPRPTALLLMLAVIAVVDVVLHADWVQRLLEPDPVRSNQLIETAALAAMSISLVQFGVKWVRTRRRIMITWITGVGSVAICSALMIPSSGWELRWWWAHLGLLIASVVFVLGTDRHMARAMDERELRLLYQPKIDLVTDELIGVEALLRWQHPDHGLVPAQDFIPMAEETDLITPFTMWAIRESVAQHRRWLDGGVRVPIAVNVTARTLRDSRLIDLITRELADKGLDASALSLELTESKALESEETGAETLNALAAFGLSIAVDDFGTGYSSLSYLRNLPVEVVKLDRSFVAPMASSQHDYTIVSSTLQMAHGLGLKVVAEGIEDEQVAGLLTQLGCEMGQGYLWSRPLPPDELLAWARGRVPKARDRGDGGTNAAEERADNERSPGSVGGPDQSPGPPKPAVENRERPDAESTAVEQGHGDRREQPAPLLGDLAPGAQDGRSSEVRGSGDSAQNPGDRQAG